MAAYGALVSLSKLIDHIQLPEYHFYLSVCGKENVISLHEKIGLLQQLLEDISGKAHPAIDAYESRIRKVAYALEDIIESNIISMSFGGTLVRYCLQLFGGSAEFHNHAKDVGILLDEAVEMKNYLENLKDHMSVGDIHPSATLSSSSQAPTAKVDLKEKPLAKIMDEVIRGPSKQLVILPITGMGGIGKTTLARAFYEHLGMLNKFDIRSWITVSQQYNVPQILRGLLPDHGQNKPDEKLIELVHKRLMGRRYLIVLDDMWDIKAWDLVRNAFPDDNKGSRIILTTRLSDLAVYIGSSSHVSHVHEMQFLNPDQSWDLLREKVGRNAHWPKKLEDLGRKISRNCRGLPLAVVAVAGLLKFNDSAEYWEQIARNTKSNAATAYDDHLLGILALSYANLPPHLKPCFLYFASFKEDYEIPTQELVRLWVSEGFLKPKGAKEMEEVAELYLEELVARSLVMVQKKSQVGGIETCRIHDVLRELSLRKAHEESFSLHITQSPSSVVDTHTNNDLRRVCFDKSCFADGLVHNICVRSLLYDEQSKSTDDKKKSSQVLSVIRHLKLIRVLGKVCITKNSQLRVLYTLANLRYLHIHLSYQSLWFGSALKVGESISTLQNLETLILSGVWSIGFSGRQYKVVFPLGIWKMPRLRHVVLLGESKLPCPEPEDSQRMSSSSLQTLSWVTNFNLTRSMAGKLSNIKKLKLQYVGMLTDKMTCFRFNHLVLLHQLLELTVVCEDDIHEVTDFAFPDNLRKLSLKGTEINARRIMSRIGSLPNLEVLKLKSNAVLGREWGPFTEFVWEPVDGEFQQLRYLKVEGLSYWEGWTAESTHFPLLETIIIEECRQLKEVPLEIGEINTLCKLVLKNCKAAEESVKEIKDEQESMCNDLLQVIVIRDRF